MLTIQTKTGPATVEPVWQGAAVAVHRPYRSDGKQTRGQWAITHAGCGMSAGVLSCDKRRAVKIARQWDGRFLAIDPADARTWPWREQWGNLLQSINYPWRADQFSADDSTATAGELAARAGIPIDQGGGALRIQWRGKFWPAPTDAELDHWTLDSVCETPDGRTVEPDASDSWLSILRLV